METKKGGFNNGSVERFLAFLLICSIMPYFVGYILDQRPPFTAYLIEHFLFWPGVIIAALSLWIANEARVLRRNKLLFTRSDEVASSSSMTLLFCLVLFAAFSWMMVDFWTSRFTPVTFPVTAAFIGVSLVFGLAWAAYKYLLNCRVQPIGVILVNDDIVTPLQVLTISPFRKYEAEMFPLFMKLERQFEYKNLIFILQFAVSVIDWSVRVPSINFGHFGLRNPRLGLQAFKKATTVAIDGELNDNLKKDNPLAGKAHSEYEAAQILERYFPKEIMVGVDQAEFRLKVELNGVRKRDVE